MRPTPPLKDLYYVKLVTRPLHKALEAFVMKYRLLRVRCCNEKRNRERPNSPSQAPLSLVGDRDTAGRVYDELERVELTHTSP